MFNLCLFSEHTTIDIFGEISTKKIYLVKIIQSFYAPIGFLTIHIEQSHHYTKRRRKLWEFLCWNGEEDILGLYCYYTGFSLLCSLLSSQLGSSSELHIWPTYLSWFAFHKCERRLQTSSKTIRSSETGDFSPFSFFFGSWNWVSFSFFSWT